MKTSSSPDPLIHKLPPMKNLIRGSLVRYVHDHCKCHPNGRYVYWYLSIKEGGRTRMRKLKDDQVPRIRQALKDYDYWWKTCLKIFEINTDIAFSKED